MWNIIITSLVITNQLLSAGIAITAFSLLLYALTFNLRDRVARTFAFILVCVVVVFVGDTISGVVAAPDEIEFWLKIQWVGIVFLPAAYLHFSDALLATTGRPSRGRRRFIIRVAYLIALAFLFTLAAGWLVGSLVQNNEPAPHLGRTSLTWFFTFCYAVGMFFSWINFYRAHQRTVTRTSRRRMQYLIAGALAPALGSYPYLLFGSHIAAGQPFIFWMAATISNALVFVLLVLMAYSVAFFGVPWPDRIVKRRLFKWLMRGPATAILVLGLTTLVRRGGLFLGDSYITLVPITMTASILLIQHLITIAAPVWERWLFHGGDHASMNLLQTLEERLLTSGDMHQFLEAVLAAVCDRLQASKAFIVSFGTKDLEMLVTVGGGDIFNEELSDDILELVSQNGFGHGLFSWRNLWLVPLFAQRDEKDQLLGIMGVVRNSTLPLDEEQHEPLALLSHRAALALEDRKVQQQVFASLQDLTPQMGLIQRLRAAARYDGTKVLTHPDDPLEQTNLSRWVKDALSHYWGGPKLTQSPLLRLRVVKSALSDNDGNPVNALREILTQAIEQTRPVGERRFTGEWLLYNILEMKFLEGRKVREIARRLAMSEADLYRKQRVAIEAVAAVIVEMEEKAREIEKNNQDPIINHPDSFIH
jgi:hypothetical protein